MDTMNRIHHLSSITRFSRYIPVFLAMLLWGASAQAASSLDWLRGRSRHLPARLAESVIVEAKAAAGDQSSCEFDICLLEVIPGEDAWWLLHDAGEKHAEPEENEEYILARFAITVLAKEGVTRFHVTDSLFRAVSKTGIVYPETLPLREFSPNIVADLIEGVCYEGWVCFKVNRNDSPVAVFGRQWGHESEAWFILRQPAAAPEPLLVPYKGQMRTGSWIRSKYRTHRNNFACADGIFIETETIPVGENGSTSLRTPDDGPPSVEQVLRRVAGTPPPESAITTTKIITGRETIRRFTQSGDWGWIGGKVFQILGPHEMLINAENQLFHIEGFATDRFVDGSPFEAWVIVTGTYRYGTVSGGSRTVWSCRIKDVRFTWPVTLDEFRELLNAGVELHHWEKDVERCPACNGTGTIVRDRLVHRIIGNITRRRIVSDTVQYREKCNQCDGRGRLSKEWVRVQDE